MSTPLDAHTTALDKAHQHVPGPGRIAGCYLWVWSTIQKDNMEERDLKVAPSYSFQRFIGAMGQGGARFLAEMVFPEGSIRYFGGDSEYASHNDGFVDGGLFVPWVPEAIAKLVFLLFPTTFQIKLPASVTSEDLQSAVNDWMARVHGERMVDPVEGDVAEGECVCFHEDAWDFPSESAQPFRETVNALYEQRRQLVTIQGGSDRWEESRILDFKHLFA